MGESKLKGCFGDKSIKFPDDDLLLNDVRCLPYFILGDDASPLRNYLMKPFGKRSLSNKMMVVNYRISRGRRVMENAVGILAICWRCFLHIMEQRPNDVWLIVEIAVLLHKFMRIRCPNISKAEVDWEDEYHGLILGGMVGRTQVAAYTAVHHMQPGPCCLPKTRGII